jgi:hypothetical protein
MLQLETKLMMGYLILKAKKKKRRRSMGVLMHRTEQI